MRDETKDAARYAWWRDHADWIADDGDDVTGCAFACQIPPTVIETKTTGELMDMIADHHLGPNARNQR